MKRAVIQTFFSTLFMVFLAGGVFAQSSGAPRIYDVEFVNGVHISTGTVAPYSPCPSSVPQGVCGNGNSKGYSLTGRAGDRISIKLSSKSRGAVFSIFRPDGELLKDGSAAISWTGELPTDGYYRINVFTNRTYTSFKIRFTRTR